MEDLSKDKIEHYMKEAIALAQKAQICDEVPVGAIIVSNKGKIVAKAHNSPIGLNDPTAHAEILAIRQAAMVLNNYRLTDTIMFVTLEPCIMCAGALVWARIKKLFFGAYDKKAGAFGSVIDVNKLPGLNHRILVQGGILKKECALLLKEFFKKRR